MQIHEITLINEGIIQDFKKQSLANKAYKVWVNYADQLEQSITDPTKKLAFNNRSDGVYKKYLTAFIQKNLLKNLPLDSLINKNEIIELINALSAPKNQTNPAAPVQEATITQQPGALSARSKVRNASPVTPTQQSVAPSAPVQPTTPPADIAPTQPILTPAKEKELFMSLVQQAALAERDPESRSTQRTDAKIISNDPIIVTFDGRTYGLDDNGNWSDIKNHKTPIESTQQYLDTVAGYTK
jgi:hypothetical protein